MKFYFTAKLSQNETRFQKFQRWLATITAWALVIGFALWVLFMKGYLRPEHLQ